MVVCECGRSGWRAGAVRWSLSVGLGRAGGRDLLQEQDTLLIPCHLDFPSVVFFFSFPNYLNLLFKDVPW